MTSTGSDNEVSLNKDTDSKLEKERKNRETYDRSQKLSFTHGVEGNSTGTDDSSSYFPFLPVNNEDVYILIRNAKQFGNASEDSATVNHSMNDSDVSSDELHGNTTHNFNDNDNDEAKRGAALTTSYSAEDGDLTSLGVAAQLQQNASQVYHHRVSLLENVPHLCGELISPSLNFFSPPESISSEGGNSATNFTQPQIVSYISSGQSIMPGPISQSFIPVKHELVILHHVPHQLSQYVDMSMTAQSEEHGVKTLEDISASIILMLQKSNLMCHSHNILLCPSTSLKVMLQGIGECVVKNDIILQTKASNSLNVEQSVVIGQIYYAHKDGSSFHISMINLTELSCVIWNIDDKRLLWCTKEKFLSQFTCPSPTIFKPLCMYPMKFTHDLSFWVEGEGFNASSFYDVVRNIADDLVYQVSLKDSYEDPVTNRNSRCYRLHFQSKSQALPYLTTWKLQSRIRIEVAKSLGVTLR